MQELPAEYARSVSFSATLPDEASWESRLMDFGLHREAFSISRSAAGNVVIRFWEPDRIEALDIMARLDGFCA